MSSRLIAPTLLAAAAMGLASLGPTTSASPFAAATLSPGVTTAVSRTIQIDGQSVQVILEVARSDAAVSPPPPTPSTGVFLTLRTTDGQDLPILNATQVRLERARPPRRSSVQALLPVLTFRFDPTSAGYAAEGYPAYRVGSRVKAAIRLETAAGVRYVRFSDVRVGG